MNILTRTVFFAALCSMTVACIDSAPSSGNNANNVNNSINVNNANTANNLNNVNNSNDVNNANNTNAQTNNADWHLPNWNKRIGFDITPTGFDGTLNDFTAVVRLDLSAAPDIDLESSRFTTSEGATIPHEVAKHEQGESIFWLRLPEVTENETQRVWLYWESTGGSGDPTDTWGSQFSAVYHFDFANLGLNSVIGEPDLACNSCLRSAGSVGMALDANQEGLVGDLPDKLLPGPGDIVAASVWYRADTGTQVRGPLISAESFCVGWQLALVSTTNEIYASAAADDDVVPMNDTTYCNFPDGRQAATAEIVDSVDPTHLVVVFDRTQDEAVLYIDGAIQGRENMQLGATGNDTSEFQPRLRIGTYGDPTLPYLSGGTIDEVFLMTGEVDDEWVAAHYANVRTWSEATTATGVQIR